jgi:hypothetical protein
MIRYRHKSVLTLAEVWWEPVSVPHADITFYWGLHTPLPGLPAERFHTVLVDLTSDEQSLRKKMSSTTAYEIRRAAKDHLVYRSWFANSPAVLEEFASFYDNFAAAKDLEHVDRSKLRIYSQSGVLDLSRVEASDGRVLVWHAYIRRGSYARLLHSASTFRAAADPEERKLVSRANRYHHWTDIERFRPDGIHTLDLGGWYAGTDNTELLRVNHFKESLGGDIVCTYNQVRPQTLKGRLFRKYVNFRTSRLTGSIETRGCA